MKLLKKHANFIVAGILLVHFLVSLSVSSQESAIYDEKAHIPAAYSYVRYGDMRLNPEHPPLLKDLAGLPLLAFQPTFPLDSEEWQSGTNEQWAIGDMFINCTKPDIACNDADAILFWSRLPIILLSLLLGLGIFIWTKELGGTLAGLFAVTLYAADPNILAHNHYVTTDIGIAATIFFACYFFIRFLQHPQAQNIVFAGIFLGIAELTKSSAALLLPLFGLFTLLYAVTVPLRTDTSKIRQRFSIIVRYLSAFIGSLIICFTLIWLLYAINTFHMPAEQLTKAAHLYLGQNNIFAQKANALVIWTSHSVLLKPFSEYLLGVFMVFARVASGNPHYFLGTVSMESSPWYFPVVFILKSTLPFLFLLFFTLGYTITRISKVLFMKSNTLLTRPLHFFGQSLQDKTPQYLICFFILFYGFISITGNLTIGIRHLFPFFPFLYMLIAKTTLDFLKRQQNNPTTHTVLTWILGGIVFIIVSIPILTYPGYLSYFNPIVGGSKNGYRYVTDSNYDWGQDLKNLSVFVERHNRCKTGTAYSNEIKQCALTQNYPLIEHIRVDYFGGSDPAYYLHDTFISWWDKREPEPGWYAISSFFYQESLYKSKPIGTQDYSWLQNITPITRAGDSIFIYYLSPQEILNK
ncbi:MAG: ArnT family glycosyltransferase [Minisyncoccota bacterium]